MRGAQHMDVRRGRGGLDASAVSDTLIDTAMRRDDEQLTSPAPETLPAGEPEAGGNDMKVVALQGSPNDNGLTASLAEAALQGAAEAGADTELVQLTEYQISSCGQCNNGWFKCREEGWCVIEDDFADIREKIMDADAWVLVTPVYFGDLSECVKAFTDRLRRCNVGAKGQGLEGKPVIGVAAAGGSGRGTPTCLMAMDRLFTHVGAEIADLITVTRRSSEYKGAALRVAARQMCEQMRS